MSPFFIKILTIIFPGVVWRIPTDKKELFLTFDDGPHPLITPKVLNILDRYNAKATFFCVGANVQKYPAVYAEIILQGHQTGNHTYHHQNGWKTGRSDYFEEVQKCHSLISSNLFRPPYGKIYPGQLQILRKNDYHVVMWNVLTRDYRKSSDPAKLLRKAIKKATPGSVIVFHDSDKAAENMLYMLPEFLEHFSGKGYTFSTITSPTK